MPHPAFDELKKAYSELADLRGAAALLGWDEQTYMPPRGAEARARQLAALSSVIHEKIVSPRFDALLDPLRTDKASLTPDEEAFVRELVFERDRARKLPPSLVRELALAESHGFAAWHVARRGNNFNGFAPNLKRLIDLACEKADCFGWEASPWDALVQDYERGMTAENVQAVFTPLRQAVAELVRKIADAPQADVSFLDQTWDVARQRELVNRVAADLGFDFETGRQDVSAHPFTTGIGHGDVRITTRFSERDLLGALGGTIHETGHALYDQGFREADYGTPLANAPSYGVHESQSRFWEVQIGQSLPYWNHYMPILRQAFPGQLGKVSAEAMWRAVNRVEPSLIRTESDEVTYSLHIIVRFELERLLLEKRLPVEDLPAEWNRRYREYLGIEVPSNAEGCLQDVHWAVGSFAYFPSYTFGNLYASMFVEKMEADIPDLWSRVGRGEFSAPLGWLRRNIHEPGRRLLPVELVERASGRAFSAEPMIARLRRKYGELYGL